MQPVRIAYVRYLNTTPLVTGLETLDGVELTAAAPSRIRDLVLEGRADIGLVSIVDAAQPGLTPLTCGIIGCDGPTMTVRVFSDVPLDQIHEIHADTESHTSVALCQVLLARDGRLPRMTPFDAREGQGLDPSSPAPEWPPSLLLIGDKVVTQTRPIGRYPHQLDLGERWKQETGLPFVYATWACRSGEEGSDRIQAAAALLDRQRRHNRKRLEWIVASRARDHRWPEEVARRYLGELLRYELGEPERLGAEVFIDRCRKLGVLSSATLRWAPPCVTVGTPEVALAR